ncbi:MAG: hypothetical protein ABSB95_01170 [Dissulfurispiraceae bacterium]|jgi:hypothetical protein
MRANTLRARVGQWPERIEKTLSIKSYAELSLYLAKGVERVIPHESLINACHRVAPRAGAWVD